MTYHVFYQSLISEIRDLLRDGESVETRRVSKTNGVELDGFIIRTPGSSVSPTYYPELSFGRYLRGSSVREIALSCVERHRWFLDHFGEDPFLLGDFEEVRPDVRLRLLNREMNRELLKDLPFYPILDLAAVFYVQRSCGSDSRALAMIRNSQMEIWKQSAESLMKAAVDNMSEQEPADLRTMEETLNRMTSEFGEDLTERASGIPLYVYTTKSRMYGASVILYDNSLIKLSEELESDLILIPSSVHEWILTPDTGLDGEYVNQMIRDINRTEVEKDDVLSDHFYRFGRAEQAVTY